MLPVTTNSIGFPLLTLILFLPAAAGTVCMLLDSIKTIRAVAISTAVVNFVLAMGLLFKFQITRSSGVSHWVFQFTDNHSWISGLGIRYLLGVDGIAVFLVGLTTLMMGVAIIAAHYMIADRVKSFMVFMLFLETGILGVFMAANLFLFYMFWEAMLIPMYFLLGLWGEERRVYATMKFLVYTIFGSFLMLVGIFYLWSKTGTLDMVGNGPQAGLIGILSAHPLSSSEQTWLFLAFGLAFAIKLPLFPFHTWAPTAYSESSVPVVIALAGILSKAGAFGFLRYSLPLFPDAARSFSGPISVLAVIGILYAAGLALVQTDIKRVVAYSSISHMNLIALGIFALNPTSLDGSALQMINHSVIISGLFLFVAFIAARTGTRSIASMGGLGLRRPVLMWLFFVFVLAGLDLPGLSSFAGEFLILAGAFRANVYFASVAALVVILAAWYMIRLFQDTMNGPTVEEHRSGEVEGIDPTRTAYQFPVLQSLVHGDLRRWEVGVVVPLVVLILYLGIQPDPVTARLNPTTEPTSALVQHIQHPSATGVGR